AHPAKREHKEESTMPTRRRGKQARALIKKRGSRSLRRQSSALLRMIVCILAPPPNRGALTAPKPDGTSVPVEEPSTASEADICSAAKQGPARSWTRAAKTVKIGSDKPSFSKAAG